MGGVIAGVPSGLVIDEHMYIAHSGGIGHREGVAITDGKRFLHYRVYAAAGALFNYLPMIERIGIHDHGRRMDARNHFVERSKIKSWVQMVLSCVTIEELPVRFRDTKNLHVGALQRRVEESGYMPMHEPNHADTEDRSSCLRRPNRSDRSSQEEQPK